jgi:RNA recognition motif-containing protein
VSRHVLSTILASALVSASCLARRLVTGGPCLLPNDPGRAAQVLFFFRSADLANETGGAVKADISQDRQSGRSRGFGTVLFETEEQAQAAIEVRWPFRFERNIDT